MIRQKLKAICAKAIVAGVVTSGLLALGAQTASAEEITVTVPFSFFAGGHNFPVGTYQFNFLSAWLLSIRNTNGGGERFYTVHPQAHGWQASHGRIVFRNSGGHKDLEAVCRPDGPVEALPLAPLTPELQSLAQNTTVR